MALGKKVARGNFIGLKRPQMGLGGPQITLGWSQISGAEREQN